MVIIKLMGGLGNQMQQYALYQKFIALGRETYLDDSWFSVPVSDNCTSRSLELGLFPEADYKIADKEQISCVIGRDNVFSRIRSHIFKGSSGYIKESGLYMADIFERDNIYLEGYWSAEKNYADILPLLRDKFNFDKMLINAPAGSIEAAQQISGSAYSCSIHIRRGDYLNSENAALFGGIATPAYYDSAIGYIRETHPETKFYIFSDDPGYAREVYGDDPSCFIVDVNHGKDSFFDIYLMSLCNAHICANSSFSFWGVRLDKDHNPVASSLPGYESISPSNDICIRPTIHVRTQEFDADIMKDLWKGWTFIDPEGIIR